MGFARTVIYDWLNKYRAGGIEPLRALPIPGRPPKLTEQQRAWVYRTVTQNNPLQLQFEFALWTRAMVRDLIRQNCGVTLSLASVGRLLRSLGLTPQRPVRRAIETGARQGPGVADGRLSAYCEVRILISSLISCDSGESP